MFVLFISIKYRRALTIVILSCGVRVFNSTTKQDVVANIVSQVDGDLTIEWKI